MTMGQTSIESDRKTTDKVIHKSPSDKCSQHDKRSVIEPVNAHPEDMTGSSKANEVSII